MSFETGKIGRQANGAVVAKTQDTMVYSTVCFESEPSAVDFTPLRIDYFARYSAIGQTIGAFHRRDSRGDDTEILVARLIDRPIRPMIDSGWQHDTQILTWVLSYDKTNGPEALAICAASAATAISEVPFAQPIAGVEVGMINGTFIVNPTKQEMKESSLQMTIAGTKTGVLMIEGSADFLTEAQLLEALQIGHKAIGQICDAIVAFRKVVGKPKKVDTLRVLPEDLVDNIDQMYGERIIQALSHGDKSSRGSNIGLVEGEIIQRFVKDIAPIASVGLKRKDDTLLEMSDSGAPIMEIGDDGDVIVFEDNSPKLSLAVSMEDEASELAHVRIANTNESSGKVGYGYNPIDVQIAIKKLLVRKLRQLVLRTGRRSDGRSREDVRPISIEHGWLPGPHGSALFTRGETQSISTATLGSKAMEARIETLDELTTKRFYLQYRFPPCSVGEVGKVTGTSRREVGHGNLAERALLPSLPGMDVFPYSIRAESLITESSGSSSMATVCGCSLAMLDAGVPLKQVVAGVAMGLILGEHADEPPVILTDILGLEDALGTMDFKVAGSEDGVTTFQLDIKCEGLTLEILQDALAQAKRGRVHILNEMIKALPGPKAMKSTIPRILSIKVDPEILGKIIGPKGKTVQGLIETHKLININLEDDGSIQIESFSEESNEAAKQAIIKITEEDSGNKRGGPRGGGKKTANEGGEEVEVVKGPPPEDGLIYRERPITGVHNFGVFVEVVDGYEGLIHVSELDTKKVTIR